MAAGANNPARPEPHPPDTYVRVAGRKLVLAGVPEPPWHGTIIRGWHDQDGVKYLVQPDPPNRRHDPKLDPNDLLPRSALEVRHEHLSVAKRRALPQQLIDPPAI